MLVNLARFDNPLAHFVFLRQLSVTAEVAESLKQYPIEIRGRRAPIKPDEEQPHESDAMKLLPPPLLPQKLSESPVPPAGGSYPPDKDLFEQPFSLGAPDEQQPQIGRAHV